jgi:hypothetical protein
MNCKDVRSHFPDLIAGDGADERIAEHLRSCASCASEVNSLRRTLSMLDEWEAPAEVSPYFMTRLRARIREEEDAAPARGWLMWVRKPVLAATMAVLLVAAGGLSMLRTGGNPQPIPAESPVLTGSAVADLQYLEGNTDLLTEFELLDELDVQNQN